MMKSWFHVILLISLVCSPAFAADDWWFDVEVILFSRDATEVQEKFSPVVHPIDIRQATDILSPYLWPDISAYQQMLPLCQQPQPTPAAIFRPWVEKTQQPVTITDPSLSEDTITSAPINKTHFEFSATDWQQLSRIDCRPEPTLATLFARPAKHTFINAVPVKISGIGHRYPVGTHLIDQQELQLSKIYQQIYRQRGLQPMLHLGWRQEVVYEKENAKNLRLFAGKNFSNDFDYWGKTLSKVDNSNDMSPLAKNDTDESADSFAMMDNATDDIVTRIEQALAAPERSVAIEKQEQFVQQEFTGTLPADVWELDGLFKVYLQNINGVPYLHIDSQFNYRYVDVLAHTPIPLAPTEATTQTQTAPSQLLSAGQQQNSPDKFLYSVPFNQLRRVISKQVHYFDHPYFGMVVQIRRYNVPERDDDDY